MPSDATSRAASVSNDAVAAALVAELRAARHARRKLACIDEANKENIPPAPLLDLLCYEREDGPAEPN